MTKLLSQYQNFKRDPSSGAFSFLVSAKKELYDEMLRVAEQAGEKFIKTVIEKARKNTEKEISQHAEEIIKEMQKEIKNLHAFAIEIKTGAMKGDKGDDADEEAIIANVLKQLPKVKDGKDADEEKIISKVMNQLPEVKDGRDADEEKIIKEVFKKTKKEIQNEIMAFFLRNPKKEMTEEDIAKIAKGFSFIFDPKQWAEQIARAMEGLAYEKKLDYEEGLKNKPGVPVYKKIGARMGRGTGNATKYYDLSSELNGVLTSFTIPANLRVIDVRSSSSPFAFRQTTDYTYTSTSLTFTSQVEVASTLAAGQTLYIIYVEA